MRQSAKSPQAKGREFEHVIASMYEHLGFKVTKNVLLAGKQIDILVERIVSGIGYQRIIVECKYRTTGSVSNAEVYELSQLVGAVAAKHNISNAVLITNSSFSKEATAAAEDIVNVSLMTTAELENQLFDVHTIYRNYINHYETTEIYSCYIPLHAKGALPFTEHQAETSKDIERAISAWVKSPKPGGISIFADYGAGKTTLLERIKYNFAKDFVAHKSILKPFLIQLRSFFKHTPLDELITRSLFKEFQLTIPMTLFWKLASEGHFLLLLDGFDEMVSQVDINVREHNFLTISPLLTLKSKALLTCRPSYFISHSEYENLINVINHKYEPAKTPFGNTQSSAFKSRKQKYRQLRSRVIKKYVNYSPLRAIDKHSFTTVELKTFDDRQVDSYLRKHENAFQSNCGCSWKEVKRYLLSVYDLKDLMKRPILLSMITETILSGSIDISSTDANFGPASLYELYTSSHLDIDWYKGESRHFLTKDQRQLFSEAVALGMLKQGKLDIDYAGILSVIADNSDIMADLRETIRDATVDEVAADIQVTTFLTRNEDHLFRFMHKSFMEFFVARYIKRKLMVKKGTDPAFKSLLPKEILYFIGSFAMFDPNFKNTLMSLYKHKKLPHDEEMRHFRRNAAGALLYSGPDIRKMHFEATVISQTEIMKNLVKDCSFRNVTFDSVSWKGNDATNCKMKSVTYRKSQLSEGTFQDSTLDLALDETCIEGTRFVQSRVSMSGVDSRLTRVGFRLCDLTTSGQLLYDSCLFLSCQVRVSCLDNPETHIKNGEFIESSLEWSLPEMLGEHDDEEKEEDRYKVGNCRFVDSFVFGLTIPQEEFESLKFDNSVAIIILRGHIRTELKRQIAPKHYVIKDGPVVLVERLGFLRKNSFRKQLLSDVEQSYGMMLSSEAKDKLYFWME